MLLMYLEADETKKQNKLCDVHQNHHNPRDLTPNLKQQQLLKGSSTTQLAKYLNLKNPCISTAIHFLKTKRYHKKQ